MAIKFTITNATVVPFFRKDKSQPEEVLKAFASKSAESKIDKVMSFTIETRIYDTASGNGKHFKQITVFSKSAEQTKFIESTIKSGAVIEIEGTLTSQKSTKDDKYYDNFVADSIRKISEGVDLPEQNNTSSDNPDDDLPF